MASGSEVLFSGGDEGRQKERGSSVPMATESERGGIRCCSWPEPGNIGLAEGERDFAYIFSHLSG